MPEDIAPVAVIGAGWAGLSCAHDLNRAGLPVTLVDAAPAPGGRARNARVTLAGHQLTLDNGQHLLIGAYAQALSLIKAVDGVDKLHRMPMQLCSDRLALARRGPGRIGLALGFLCGSGLTVADRFALVRFGATLAAQRWQCRDGETVQQLLTRCRQTERLMRRVWRPLCVGALNTEPGIACAQTFANVLNDAMLLSADGSDYLVSQVPLSTLFAHPMWSMLQDRGVSCLPRYRASGLEPLDSGGWRVQTPHGPIDAGQVVLATPWHVSAALLAPIQPAASRQLAKLPSESIRTVYLAWQADQVNDLPALRMLSDDASKRDYGQWFFKRTDAQGTNDLAVAAVVVSAADAIDTNADQLCTDVAAQVSRQLRLPPPVDAICINEKRATFRCTPDRPAVDHGSVAGHLLPGNLLLAGDYCIGRYPATLESAVLSGRGCAQQVIALRTGKATKTLRPG